MVSPLKYFRRDPNKTKTRNRGAGYYYKRSSYKRGWYSKYSAMRDAKKRDLRKSKRLSREYQHAGDLNTHRKIKALLNVSPRKKELFKGWF